MRFVINIRHSFDQLFDKESINNEAIFKFERLSRKLKGASFDAVLEVAEENQTILALKKKVSFAMN